MRSDGPPALTGSLTRSLGLASAVALIVGEVVGVGIFLTPADMAKSLGSPFWILVVWTLMGLMAATGALCYGELAARHPEAGGGYAYLREAYGRGAGFLYGWKSLVVMDPGLTAALAIGLASYARAVTGLGAGAQQALAVGAILSIAATNIAGARIGAGVLRALTALKLGLLAAIVLRAFGAGLGDWSHFTPFVAQRAGSPPLGGALAGGIVAAFFSFGGWWDMTKVAGEIRDPARTLPRALVLGVAIVTAMYVLTSAAFIYLVPIEAVASGEAFAAQAGTVLFGEAGGRILSAIVVVAVLSSLAGLMMAAPRVYFAMARDGVFPAGVAAVHPRFGTPARAIALQAVLASLLVFVGTFGQIIAYFIFVTVAFIGLTVAGLFVLRRRAPEAAGFRVPLFPLTPLVFLALVALLLVMLASQNPREAALGVLVMAAGWPIHRLLYGRTPPPETAA